MMNSGYDEMKVSVDEFDRQQRFLEQQQAIIDLMNAGEISRSVAQAVPGAVDAYAHLSNENFIDEQTLLSQDVMRETQESYQSRSSSSNSLARTSDRGLGLFQSASFRRSSSQSNASSAKQPDGYMDEKRAIIDQMQRQQNYMDEKQAIIAMMKASSSHQICSPPLPPSDHQLRQAQQESSDALIATLLESQNQALIRATSGDGISIAEQQEIERALSHSAQESQPRQPGAFSSNHIAFITPPVWANQQSRRSSSPAEASSSVTTATTTQSALGVAVGDSVTSSATSAPLHMTTSLDPTARATRPGAFASNQPAFLRPPAWANQQTPSSSVTTVTATATVSPTNRSQQQLLLPDEQPVAPAINTGTDSRSQSRRTIAVEAVPRENNVLQADVAAVDGSSHNRDMESPMAVTPEFARQYKQERRLKIFGVSSLILAIVVVIGVSAGLLIGNHDTTPALVEPVIDCPVNFDLVCKDDKLVLPTCLQKRYDFVKNEVLPKLHPNHDKLRPCDPASMAGVALAVHDPVVTGLSYYALATLYFATGGQTWRRSIGWLETRSFCSGVHGIVCDASGKFYLNLVNNYLKGTLPTEIGLLRHSLKSLKIGSNPLLEGTIPTEIGQLDFLSEFVINDSAVKGTIPTEFGTCKSMERLSIISSTIEGSIPSELAQLSDTLVGIDILGNQMSGYIPTEFGQLTNLVVMNLDTTFMGRVFPTELGQMTSLEVLRITAPSSIKQPFPLSLTRLTNLETLILNYASLSGSLPTELGLLTNMVDFSLSSNGLSGPLPTELGNMRNLAELQIVEQSISGQIPSELGLLTEMKSLGLWRLRLSGTIPSELGLLTNLHTVDMALNKIEGTLPDELCPIKEQASFRADLCGECTEADCSLICIQHNCPS